MSLEETQMMIFTQEKPIASLSSDARKRASQLCGLKRFVARGNNLVLCSANLQSTRLDPGFSGFLPAHLPLPARSRLPTQAQKPRHRYFTCSQRILAHSTSSPFRNARMPLSIVMPLALPARSTRYRYSSRRKQLVTKAERAAILLFGP